MRTLNRRAASFVGERFVAAQRLRSIAARLMMALNRRAAFFVVRRFLYSRTSLNRRAG